MFSLVEVAIQLEEVLEIDYEDGDLEPLLENNAAKISDFAEMTMAKLSTNSNEEEVVVVVNQQILEIFRSVGNIPINRLTLEMNLFKALDVPYKDDII